ncbi:pyridoxal-phosphate dependent enzyme [Halioglobus maricola]|uniref:Pyridoxal-phosphate dependent enzyme n=2 Tax=Halioglobus maricola TaxID=2601894 RepID=A0A5P9NP93_9GAMM|nr:pyridoxal-phosphate dependent enzyme [Halioglobus maricola]
MLRIADGVHETPVMQSRLLNKHTGSHVFFKCEHLQRVGAFKARGALNAVLSLSDDEAANGVATHSSGNHGAALAMAAAQRGIPAHIVMPSNAPDVKKEAVAAYGGLIIECEPTQQARAAGLEQVLAGTGAHAVHPFLDSRVIAGQGTVALELLKQVPDLDVIAVPVGGGGLLSGTAIAAKHINPKIEVIAVEPEGADDAFRSFGLGELQGNSRVDTIADGLRTSLGELNFEIIRKHVDTIVAVPDALIVEAMELIWTRMKQVVEPSGAVSFAGLLEHPERFRGRRTGVVITGGNVDLGALPF